MAALDDADAVGSGETVTPVASTTTRQPAQRNETTPSARSTPRAVGSNSPFGHSGSTASYSGGSAVGSTPFASATAVTTRSHVVPPARDSDRSVDSPITLSVLRR